MMQEIGWRSPDRAEPIVPEALMAGDDRRMQVRAYKFWASLLHGQPFPRIGDLDLHNLPDFGPSSVLLDLSGPIPAIRFLGDQLRAEAGLPESINTLAQIPPRSLISRLTDRCADLVSSQNALGFEAEFLSHKGQETLYRGLLLPFSSNGAHVDFAYGVISWKTRDAPVLRQARRDGRSAALLRVKPDQPLWREATLADWISRACRRG